MEIPKDLKYAKTHEWVRVEGDVAYVGISDYAQEELGEDALYPGRSLFARFGR